MSQRQGQVDVSTEVGYCPSCGRSRTLRSEAHHLGQLVRTIVTCETCHRTLSSSIGVAAPEPVKAEQAPQPEPAPRPAPAPAPVKKAAPAAKAAAPVKKVAPAKKPAARKPAAAKKPAPAKKATPKKAVARSGKPTSTATRKTTRRK